MNGWTPNPNAFREHEASRIGEALAVGLSNYESGNDPAALAAFPAKEFRALMRRDDRAARELPPDVLAAMLALREQMTAARS